MIGNLPSGITASPSSPVNTIVDGKITVTLTADDTVNGSLISDFQDAIEAISFNNTQGTPDASDRLIDVSVFDITGLESNIAISTIEINYKPTPNDDAYTTDKNTSISIAAGTGVLNNDSDPEDNALTVTEINGSTVNIGQQITLTSGATLTLNADGSFDYDPATDDTGEDTFDYTVTDSLGNSETATVYIYINDSTANPNIPDAVDDSYSTNAGTQLTVPVGTGVITTNDTNPDGDGDTVTVTRFDDYSANSGTVSVNTDGSFTYTPPTGFIGTDTFTYTISDGNGGADTATVTIDVTNAPPDAVDDSYSTPKDTQLTVPVATGVLDNDSDPEGDTFTVTAFDSTSVNGGTVSVNADGSFNYTPVSGFIGQDAFTYTITDSNGGTDTATVTIDVTGTPSTGVPEATDDLFQAVKNSNNQTFNIGTNDSGPNLDFTTLQVISGSQNWTGGGTPTLTVNNDGTIIFNNDNQDGIYTFDYQVANDSGQITNASVTLVVEASEAVADEVSTNQATSVPIDILDNDLPASGDPTNWQDLTIVSQPANGTLYVDDQGDNDSSNDIVTYVPDPDFTGTDTFIYTVKDGNTTSETPVTINVTPVANAPEATDDLFQAVKNNNDQTFNIGTNDSGPNLDFTTFQLISGSQNWTGGGTPTLTVNNDGTIIFNNDNQDGIYTFDYQVANDSGQITNASVTLVVEASEAVADEVSTNQATSVPIDILDNDLPASGDPTNWQDLTIVSQPANGTLYVDDQGDNDSSNDIVTYVPDPDFTGTDTFTYTVRDGNTTSETPVTVNVTPCPGRGANGK